MKAIAFRGVHDVRVESVPDHMLREVAEARQRAGAPDG